MDAFGKTFVYMDFGIKGGAPMILLATIITFTTPRASCCGFGGSIWIMEFAALVGDAQHQCR